MKDEAADRLQGLNQITLTETDIFNQAYVSFLDKDDGSAEVPMVRHRAMGSQKKLQNFLHKKVSFTSHGQRAQQAKNPISTKTHSQILPFLQ